MGYSSPIEFTYTNGMLKPDHRLNLPEGARVRAVLLPAEPDAATAERALEVIRKLGASGAFRSGGRLPSRDELHERS